MTTYSSGGTGATLGARRAPRGTAEDLKQDENEDQRDRDDDRQAADRDEVVHEPVEPQGRRSTTNRSGMMFVVAVSSSSLSDPPSARVSAAGVP
jgi:hypothetical protein